MARQKLEDIISYIETQLATQTDIDTVKYTDRDAMPIPVKTYGVHIYIGDEDYHTSERKHIGPLLSETYFVRVDMIINRRFKDRNSVSDSKGISYWQDTLEALFLNGTNSGQFKDSFWEFNELDINDDIYVIKGVLTVEILNNYT